MQEVKPRGTFPVHSVSLNQGGRKPTLSHHLARHPLTIVLQSADTPFAECRRQTPFNTCMHIERALRLVGLLVVIAALFTVLNPPQ